MRNRFLKISGIIVLAIALGSFWGYNKYFKPDPEIQQELNNQFGADFFNSFDDQKTEDFGSVNSSHVVDSGSELGETTDPVVKSVDQTKVQSGDQKNTASTSGNGTVAEKQITQDDIINKYQPKFSYLQNAALSRLDTLYSAAVQEYKQSKKAGTLKRSELAQKYIQAGTMLEANVDSQFYSTLTAMKADLIANNLPTDIISATESEYEKAKSNKRSQLLSKISK